MSELHRLLAQATRLHASGRLDEAETLYARILSADSANFNALHFLGLLRAQQGRNEEALSLIGTAIRINPRLAAALTNHGNVLMALGRPAEAVASYDKSLALKPDAETLTNKAVALQALGRLEDAIAAYESVLAANPTRLQAWNNRGQALQQLQRYAQ